MAASGKAGTWKPRISRASGPLYVAIADALAADIQSGTLPAGTRLPPQRVLAEALGIDFTTVTRAYAEAGRRGLIEGRAGTGTYVRRVPSKAASSLPVGLVDMSMNLPPRIHDAGLEARMWRAIADLESSRGSELLARYQTPGGAAPDRAAGAVWLASRIPKLSADRVLLCPGTQGALLAIVGLLAAPGDTICTEALTYPGIRSLTAHLGIALSAVDMDQEGLIPEAFEAACQRRKPKALYCTPTLNNPTTATMSMARRKAVLAVAARYDVPIIEDDVYGLLPRRAPPPLAAIAPQSVHYIASLAKCLSPALRIAYLVLPETRLAVRMTGAIRALTSMSSPLTAAVATSWIEAGIADAALSAIRAEAVARQEAAKAILPPGSFAATPESFHVWLPLPPSWTRAEFAMRLSAIGIGVVASDAFAVASPPEAVRLGLGAPATRDDLRAGLEAIAELLIDQPTMSSVVV